MELDDTAGHRDEVRLLREALERLGGEVATQRGQLAQLRRARRPRRRLGAATVLALLMLAVPLTLMAAAPFTDLVPGSVHNADIEAIYAAGITTGCVPNQQYCPNDPVTRQQMASFLARVAGLGANKPVANAAQLGGQPASYYQPAGEPIANATTAKTLQGFEPSWLVRTSQGVGFPPSGGGALTADYQTIGTVNITAPRGGFILVSGVATFQNETQGTPERVDLRLRDVTASTEQGREVASAFSSATVDGATATQPWLANLTGAGTFGVPADKAGTQRTFVVEAKKQQNASGATIRYVNVTTQALFVPFGSNGGTDLAVK